MKRRIPSKRRKATRRLEAHLRTERRAVGDAHREIVDLWAELARIRRALEAAEREARADDPYWAADRAWQQWW